MHGHDRHNTTISSILHNMSTTTTTTTTTIFDHLKVGYNYRRKLHYIYIYIYFFFPMPPHYFVDFVVLPPGHGRSVTDF